MEYNCETGKDFKIQKGYVHILVITLCDCSVVCLCKLLSERILLCYLILIL